MLGAGKDAASTRAEDLAAAALAELAEVAHGRVDLLAEEAGLTIGFHEQDTDAPVYVLGGAAGTVGAHLLNYAAHGWRKLLR